MASETLLRFENCSSCYLVIVNYLRSVGSISSSRRVLRSYHRIVFFGAPLAFLRVVIPFRWLLRRFHVFVSSVFSFVDFATYVVYNFAFLFTAVTASSFKYE